MCIHDTFPTPFIDEILENVGGTKVYSFMDGFLGYHQVKIIEEDRHKMMFEIEWLSFAYNSDEIWLEEFPSCFLWDSSSIHQ